MHGTTHAKSFLDGCLTEPYIMWINNYELVEQTRDSEESHNWIKSDESEEWGESEESGEPEESGELEKLEESDLFKLKKAREYLFAVFTTQKFSIIISNTNATDGDKRFVQFNITLGINKNSMAMLEMNVNNTIIGNDTEEMAPLLPTIPYYVNVSITEKNISVYEARTNATVPFLSLNYDRNSTGNMTNEDDFFVKFVHLSSIVAHFDCCEACSPWIYTRISGCSKYSSRTARIKSEKTFSLADMISSNLPENILFSQNILINHDGGPTFSARIVFAENDNFRGNQYEIGLSDHPTIMHYFNSSTRHTERGPYFKKAYTTPFIVNITITKDGVIRLRLPYEKNEFLVYIARHEQLKPVDRHPLRKGQEQRERYEVRIDCNICHISNNRSVVDERFLRVCKTKISFIKLNENGLRISLIIEIDYIQNKYSYVHDKNKKRKEFDTVNNPVVELLFSEDKDPQYSYRVVLGEKLNRLAYVDVEEFGASINYNNYSPDLPAWPFAINVTIDRRDHTYLSVYTKNGDGFDKDTPFLEANSNYIAARYMAVRSRNDNVKLIGFYDCRTDYGSYCGVEEAKLFRECREKFSPFGSGTFSNFVDMSRFNRLAGKGKEYDEVFGIYRHNDDNMHILFSDSRKETGTYIRITIGDGITARVRTLNRRTYEYYEKTTLKNGFNHQPSQPNFIRIKISSKTKDLSIHDLLTNTPMLTMKLCNFFDHTREYLFAVFTTRKFSIIISNTHGTDGDKRFVQFNITLGINKNSMAMLEMNVNKTIIGHDTEEFVPLLPTIPYYVNVSITEKNISVYEARTNATVPFLSLNYDRNSTGNMTNEDDFFVKFVHLSSIIAHFDCCEACSPWIYTRISGCSKYSSRTAKIKSEKTFSLADMISSNLPENILFSQNILINHDGNPAFTARILFAENDDFRGNRYEIGLSDHPTIMHYFNFSDRHTERGPYLKNAYTTPFIVNITITKDGVIRLRLPYEKNDFLVYADRHEQHKPLDVKYMKMQYKTLKYDVLHIFQDFYQIYDKFPNRKYEYDSDYKRQASPTNDSIPQPQDKDSGIGNGVLKLLKKTGVGVGSFLCIGLLKFIFKLDCVKKCLKEMDVDDEEAKDLKKKN
ncbi:hypothetical protein Bhyg_00959, partial [Pseudolycoriella hygida]